MSSFYTGSGTMNSGPHTSTTCTLSIKPVPYSDPAVFLLELSPLWT